MQTKLSRVYFIGIVLAIMLMTTGIVSADSINKIYGIDFSPYKDGQNPDYGSTVSSTQVQERMQIIAPYTIWIRSYGTENGLEYVAPTAHNMGLKTAIGAWLGTDSAANERQINELISEMKAGNVDIAIVGSETLYRNDLSEEQLINYIKRVKAAAPGISVTTADAYGEILSHPNVVKECDVVMYNIYPYWEGISIENAITVIDGRHKNIVNIAGGKTVIISETGWPSGGNTIGSAVPSPENSAKYFNEFVSWARKNNVQYLYFEAFDETWKSIKEGPQGAHWGIWDKDGNMKPSMETVFNTLPNTASYTPTYDNRLRESSPTTVLSTTTYLDVGRSTSSSRDVMIFDLSSYKTTDTISKAILSLYWYYPAAATRTSDTVVEVYRPVEWDPKYVTWNNRASGTPWSNPGGSWYDNNGVSQGTTPYASLTFSASKVPDNKYYDFDVTQLVQEYVSGKYKNTGFFLKTKTESGNYIAFYSSEASNAAQKPKLAITTASAAVDNPPVANAGADKTATTGSVVTFDASASTDDKGIASYSWDFDVSNGITSESSSKIATKTYTSAATYTVTLTVTDTNGQKSTDTLKVVVTNTVDNPPVANAGADKTAIVGSAVTFDASASTDDKGIASYSWDFDQSNGITADATTKIASKTYTATGTYTVTLTVTDTAGQKSTDTLKVVVGNTPSSVSYTPTYDNRLRDSSPTTVLSTTTYLDVGRSTSISRDVMIFDLSSYKTTDTISKAILSLYWYYPAAATRTSDTVVEVYRPVEWDPKYVTWNNRASGTPWSNPGGSWYDNNGVSQGTTPYASLTFSASKVPDNKYYDFDVTQLVQEYVSGKYKNTGFFLKTKTESGNYIAFYSSEASNAAQKPKLAITTASAAVDNPPVANAGADKTATTGSVVTFDASASTDDKGIASYSWDFDVSNGITSESSSKIATKTYTSAATYTVTLTVTDTSGQKSTDTLKVVVTSPSETEVDIKLVSSYDTADLARRVAVSGNYAYVADNANGLVILDISNPTAPILVGRYDTTAHTKDVFVSGKYAYVADNINGLVILDVSNPTAPTVASKSAAGYADGLCVSGNYAYITAEYAGLIIYDISNPSSPKFVTNYVYLTGANVWPSKVTISGNYAYVVNSKGRNISEANDFAIIDISNPSSPKLVGTYKTTDRASDVAVLDKYAYIADNYGGLVILDISNPSAPILIGSYNSPDTNDVTIIGKYAYLADTLGLVILDISNPTIPSFVDSYDYYGVTGVDVSGNYVYTTNWDKGLVIYQVVTKDNPPVANAGTDKTATVGSAVTFDGSASTDDKSIASYSWDFDQSNGITADATTKIATKTYTTTGTYTVTLTVTDTAGQKSTDTLKVVVSNIPSSVSYTPTYDNRLRDSSPTTVLSTTTYLDVGRSTSSSRDVLMFDLSAYKTTDTISKATLSLYWYYPAAATRTSDTAVEVYRPVEWDPKYVTWNNRASGTPWSNAGGSWFDKNGVSQGTTPYASVTFTGSKVPDNKYYEFDVTQLVKEYVSGKYKNTGFFLKAKTESGNYIAFYSSEVSNTAQKPKLTITR
jgi:exo-beta-1,3-glucanase (GH17 family)/putative ubiquitin-RnfH superfamily antitoxin RatB of RatAB toxin-antitoxin module